MISIHSYFTFLLYYSCAIYFALWLNFTDKKMRFYRCNIGLSITTYTLRRASSPNTSIVFNATTDNDSNIIYWFIDDAYLGNSTNQRSIEWCPKESGRYRIRAVDDKGRADTRNIRVDIIGVINKQEIEAH